MKSLFQSFMLPNEDSEKFRIWAFGDSEIRSYSVPERWNALHGDVLMISPEGDMRKDAEMMVLVYREYLKDLTPGTPE